MSKFWKSKTKVKCPFYLGERDRSIVCKAHICSNVRFSFADPAEKHIYQSKNCYSLNPECIHCKLETEFEENL